MRPFLLLLLPLIFSCNNASERSDKHPEADTMVTVTMGEMEDRASSPAFLVSEQVEKYAMEWKLVNDSLANWPKDEFDYFIAPKRKTNPDYPYLAFGDFNGDNKEDVAALVKRKNTGEFELLIIEDHKSEQPGIREWKEDMDLTAISTYPRPRNGKLAMKGDGINVEFFEKATFVVYWDGKNYKRFYTAD